jgi:hypothetical protein
MKIALNRLLLLLAIPLALLSGCKTQQELQVLKLKKHSEAIRKILAMNPSLVDATMTRIKDSMKVESKRGNTAIVLSKDTSKFNSALKHYVSQIEELGYLQRHFTPTASTPTPKADPKIKKLLTVNKALRDSLQLGAFKRDTTYTYEDSTLTIVAQLHQNKLYISYVTRYKWLPYEKQLVSLGLHDCPGDKFYQHKEFWFSASGWVLIFMYLGYSLFRRIPLV